MAIEGFGEEGETATKLVFKDEIKRELHKHEKVIKQREVEEEEWWW